MMAIVPHVTSGSGLRKFQADEFLFDSVHSESAHTMGPILFTDYFATKAHVEYF